MPTICPKCRVVINPSGTTIINKKCATCQQTEEIKKIEQRRAIEDRCQRTREANTSRSASFGGGGGGDGGGDGRGDGDGDGDGGGICVVIALGVWGVCAYYLYHFIGIATPLAKSGLLGLGIASLVMCIMLRNVISAIIGAIIALAIVGGLGFLAWRWIFA